MGTSEPSQLTCAPERKHERNRSSGQREHEALSQQLARQSEAAGAESRAEGDFPVPEGHAHQREIRHVRNGKRQNQTDGAEEEEQSATNGGHNHHIRQLRQSYAPSRVPGPRRLAFETSGNHLKLALG